MKWAFWTVASWLMFVLSVFFWLVGWTDKKGNSWRKFLKGFKNPWAVLWRTSQGWRQIQLGQYTDLKLEAAIAVGIKEFEKKSRTNRKAK